MESEPANILIRQCPDASRAECERFLVGSSGRLKDATKKLENYLEWRTKFGVDELTIQQRKNTALHDNDDGGLLWKETMTKAVEVVVQAQKTRNSNEKESTNPETFDTTTAGQVLFHYCSICNNSSTLSSIAPGAAADQSPTQPQQEQAQIQTPDIIVQVIPARLVIPQNNAATAVQIYTAAMGLYLDAALFDRNDRNSKATVLIDVRAGNGWPNPPAAKLVGFIRTVASELQDFFPDRLERIILFPVPGAAIFLWKVIQRFLDRRVAEAVVLLPGNAGRNAPPPNEKLKEFVDSKVLEAMEEKRVNSFEK